MIAIYHIKDLYVSFAEFVPYGYYFSFKIKIGQLVINSYTTQQPHKKRLCPNKLCEFYKIYNSSIESTNSKCYIIYYD